MAKIYCRLFYLTFLFYSCTNKQKIDKNLAYSTISEIIQQDTIFARIVCSRFDQPTIPDDIQKEYFKNDKYFIQEQLENSINTSVDTGKIYFYWRRKGGLEKSFIDTTCSKNILYHFTYPIFSKDLQTFVFGITEDCNCMLGGWGFTGVYKRKNGKWVLIKKYGGWIS